MDEKFAGSLPDFPPGAFQTDTPLPIDNMRPCPFCGEMILRTAQKCRYCGEFLVGEHEIQTNVKQGALTGAVVCFVVGVALMCFSLWSFIIYAPLFLAAFILSIVAMAQKKVAGGAGMLILTVVVPPVLLLGLLVAQSRRAMEEPLNPLDGSKTAALVTLPSAPPGKEAPAASSSPRQDWVSAEFPVELGDVQIQLDTPLYVGRVPTQGEILKHEVSWFPGPYLAIGVSLMNNSSNQKFNYKTWAGKEFSLERDWASVKDNFGNTYRGINFTISYVPLGRVESESLYPGASIHDVLIFEKPVENVEYLEVELPAGNFGGLGMIRFRVPASMISYSAQ